jgi:hypothetical protein
MHGLATVHRLQTARDAHMACEDNLSFTRELPAEMMHLIVTSPPYNIGKRYERRSPLDAYKIDVGIEILPMKALQSQMSSGVGYYEGELYNLIREGRGVPAVPLVLVSVPPSCRPSRTDIARNGSQHHGLRPST